MTPYHFVHYLYNISARVRELGLSTFSPCSGVEYEWIRAGLDALADVEALQALAAEDEAAVGADHSAVFRQDSHSAT